MSKINLNLSFEKFEILYEVANGRGQNVSISRKDLMSLLMDHSKALGLLGDLVEYDYETSKQVKSA